jgi:methyl-accepting chemotaxis protein
MNVKTKLAVLVAFVVAGFAGFTAAAFSSLRPDVADTDYAPVVETSELVADVLPPPAYVIEAFLTLHELGDAEDPRTRAELLSKFERLEREYRARTDHWRERLPSGALRDALLTEAQRPAADMFEVARRDFVPLVRAGKLEEARVFLNGSLQDHFRRHATANDRVVVLANTRLAASQRIAADAVGTRRNLLSVLGVLLGVCAAVYGFWVSRSITEPLSNLRVVLARVAGRDLTVRATAKAAASSQWSRRTSTSRSTR